MNIIKKVAVLGGGSFGTVLANIAASNGYDVSLWVRDSDQALRINWNGAASFLKKSLGCGLKVIIAGISPSRLAASQAAITSF